MAQKKKLKAIRQEPVPPISLLGGDSAHEEAIARNRGNWLLGALQQLGEFAAHAEVSVAELLDNEPLMRLAEKDYGLFEVATAKKAGRPEFWTAGRLLHLWVWVQTSSKPNVSQALRAYRTRFETRCSTDQALNTVYHQQAIASPLVRFAIAIQQDSRTSHFVAEFMELECWRLLPGWPEGDQK